MQHANLRTHPEATEEIAEAIMWYGARSEKAATGFIEAVESAISAVLADPERFAFYIYGARSAMLKRYPFLIIYRSMAEMVDVLAIAHTSRRPGYWKDRRFGPPEP
jgi:toxin ParE1/3/4